MSTKKSFNEVAIEKKLPEVMEDTGSIMKELRTEFRASKSGQIKDISELYPNEDQLAKINELAMEPQRKEQWIVLPAVRSIGSGGTVDSHGDKFSKRAEKDMADQSYGTPVLMDHNHDLNGNPPPGISLGAGVDSKGLYETLAMPLEDYNASLIKGIKNGTVRFISVGLLVKPENKVCSSCEKSIYSYDCPHMPGRKDEEGKMVHATITGVERMLERSFVSTPARMGTSLKSLDEPTLIDLEADLASYSTLSVIQNGGLLGEIVTLSGENTTAVTIPLVNTIEDSTLAQEGQEQTDTPKAEEVVVETPAAEEVVVEAPKAEEAAPVEEKAIAPLPVDEKLLDKPEVKTSEVVHKAVIDEDSAKAIDSVVKASAAQAETVKKLMEGLEEQKTVNLELAKQVNTQSAQINKLLELQVQLAKVVEETNQTVKDAANVSTTTVLEKVMASMVAAKSNQVKTEEAKLDWTTQLLAPTKE